MPERDPSISCGIVLARAFRFAASPGRCTRVAAGEAVSTAGGMSGGWIAGLVRSESLAGAARFYLRGTEEPRNRATPLRQCHAIRTFFGVPWSGRRAFRSRRVAMGMSPRSVRIASQFGWVTFCESLWARRHPNLYRQTSAPVFPRSRRHAIRSRWTSVPRFHCSSEINSWVRQNCHDRSIMSWAAREYFEPLSGRSFCFEFRRASRHRQQ